MSPEKLHPSINDNAQGISQESTFIGRERELSQLEVAYFNAASGRATLATVAGSSGCGKSRFLAEFGLRVKKRGANLFVGQAVHGQTQNPCEALARVVSGIVQLLRRDKLFRAEFERRLTWESAPLCSIFPELREFLHPPMESATRPLDLQTEASSLAVVLMLNALWFQRKPAVIIFDDMQWADSFTLKVLEKWSASAPQSGARVLIVLAHRSEESPGLDAIRRIVPHPTLTIAPFDDGTLSLFLESLAGPLGGEALNLISKLSGGNAFLSSCILRGMIDSKMLQFNSGCWVPAEIARPEAAVNSGFEFIRRRLEVLEDGEKAVVNCAAVHGGDFDPELFQCALKLSSDELLTLLGDLERRHIIVAGERPGTFRFAHSKLREAAIELLSPAERVALHQRLAHAIESVGHRNPYELAAHYDGAEEPYEAFSYALDAIADARTRTSLSALEDNLRIAIRGSVHQPQRIRFELLMEQHSVLMLRGKYQEASRHLDQALALASTADDHAAVFARRTEQALKEGELDQALLFGEQAVRLRGGKTWPKKVTVTMLFVLMGKIGVHILHHLFPQFFRNREPVEGGRSVFLRAQAAANLGVVSWWERTLFHTLMTHFDILNSVDRYEPSTELIVSYADHGVLLSLTPFRGLADRYLSQSLQWSRERRDLRLEGRTLCWYCVSLLAQSRFEESLNYGFAALRVLEQSGDLFYYRMSEANIGHALYRLGNLREAAALFERVYRQAMETGDIASAADALVALARTIGGVAPEYLAAVKSKITPGNLLSTAMLSLPEAFAALREKEHDQAISLLESGIRILRDNVIINEYCAPLYFWHLTALRMKIETLPLHAPERRSYLARAKRGERRASKLARQFSNNIPHLLREIGLLALARGRERRALRYLQESLEEAEVLGMRYEHALTQFEFGRVAHTRGWPQRELMENGYGMLSQLGANMMFLTELLDDNARKALAGVTA